MVLILYDHIIILYYYPINILLKYTFNMLENYAILNTMWLYYYLII